MIEQYRKYTVLIYTYLEFDLKGACKGHLLKVFCMIICDLGACTHRSKIETLEAEFDAAVQKQKDETI